MIIFVTCKANSRVGDKISALAPAFALRIFNFSNNGIKKHAVFPLPVLAIATTSRPSSINGMVCINQKNVLKYIFLRMFYFKKIKMICVASFIIYTKHACVYFCIWL